MAKFTKKWEKEFPKRYQAAIKQLKSLEEEYKEMVKNNPDEYINFYIDDNDIDFYKCDNWYTGYNPPPEEDKESDEPQPNEGIGLMFTSELGSFSFDIDGYEDCVKFRNEIIEVVDKIGRPVEEEYKPRNGEEECMEMNDMTQEEWDALEETDYTVQVSRDCVHKWTHTVKAKSGCHAEWKLQNGEDWDNQRHNEDDEFDDYGNQTYECID